MQHDMSVGVPCHSASADGGCSETTDHLSYWSTILSVIPSDFAALILALVAACACVWLVCRGIWNPAQLAVVLQLANSPPATYLPRHSLQEAFSNGILHPKLYRAAT